MRICIFGAGAIGGFFGARLALAGFEPSLIARGAHLAAMRANGLKLISGGEEHVVQVRCSDDPGELGPHDVVIPITGRLMRSPGLRFPRPSSARSSGTAPRRPR